MLRGGPSPIFANGQPGATTNFILKEGTPTPHLCLRATYGTEGQYRGDFVAQGPIDDSTTYMIGGFYRYSDGLRHTGFTGDLGGQITARSDAQVRGRRSERLRPLPRRQERLLHADAIAPG